MDNYNQSPTVDDKSISLYMSKVFFWMFIGLAVTAITSYLTLATGLIGSLLTRTSLILLPIVEVALVMWLSRRIHKLSTNAAISLFLLYAVVNGLTLSVIFLIYDISTITLAFVTAAGMFGIMAAYGYFTKNNLSRYGTFFFMAVIGLVIASVLNLFIQSSQMAYIVSLVGVVVFAGLTAYDLQMIKTRYYPLSLHEGETGIMSKSAIMPALHLYLDFINIFLYLLRLLGRRD